MQNPGFFTPLQLKPLQIAIVLWHSSGEEDFL